MKLVQHGFRTHVAHGRLAYGERGLMSKRFAALLVSVLCALMLVACSTTITKSPNGGKVEFSELDDTVDSFFDFGFSDITMDIELESGSVDIEVVDVDVISHEDEEYIELDTIYTASGLVSGDTITCSDDDGSFVLRVTGHDATGAVTIAEG